MSIASRISDLVTAIASAINSRNAVGASDYQMWLAQGNTGDLTAYRAAQLGADADWATQFQTALGPVATPGTASETQAGVTQFATAAEINAGTIGTKAVSALQFMAASLAASIVPTAGPNSGKQTPQNRDVSGGDWNTQVATGFFEGSNMANTPGGGTGWNWVVVQRFSDDWIQQTADTFTTGGTTTASVGAKYVRSKINGVWGAWTRLVDEGRQVVMDRKGIGVNDSFETLVTPGVYQFNGGAGQPTGFPTGGDNYGELIVFAQQYGVVQLYVGATTFIRSQWNALNQTPQNMGRANWQQLTTTTVAPK